MSASISTRRTRLVDEGKSKDGELSVCAPSCVSITMRPDNSALLLVPDQLKNAHTMAQQLRGGPFWSSCPGFCRQTRQKSQPTISQQPEPAISQSWLPRTG